MLAPPMLAKPMRSLAFQGAAFRIRFRADALGNALGQGLVDAASGSGYSAQEVFRQAEIGDRNATESSGNAIAQGFVEGMQFQTRAEEESQRKYGLAVSGAKLGNGSSLVRLSTAAVGSDSASPDALSPEAGAFYDTLVAAISNPPQIDTANATQLAAGNGFNLGGSSRDAGGGRGFVNPLSAGVDSLSTIEGELGRAMQVLEVDRAGNAIVPSGQDRWQLGDLSRRFETGGKSIATAAGTVSSGVDDKGGISYGAYQLASSAAGGRQVQQFLQFEGSLWATNFAGMDPTQPGIFGQQWRAIAQDAPIEFFSAQHSYIQRTHYDPVVNYLLDKTGLDIRTQPAVVQDVVWSASVQHGGAKFFLTDAINVADQRVGRSSNDYAATLINAMYDRRIDYVSNLNIPNKQTLLQVRYPAERQQALEMLFGR